MNIAIAIEREPDPIEIDPRPCELCGLTIDKHWRVDTPEGPEFFCVDPLPEDMDPDELERRDELRRREQVAAVLRRWELADDRDTGEAPPASADGAAAAHLPYRTPQSTIDAFWYVVSLDNPDYLKRWLADHPRDVATLQKLSEAKHACA